MTERARARWQPSEEFLAITPEALECEWISVRSGDRWYDSELYRVDSDTGVAEVSISGPLDRAAFWLWDGYSGPEGIESRVTAALNDSRVKSLVLRLDSPGGTVSGLFECVDALRAAKADAGKPIIAFAEGSGAFSAAYALSTIADELLVTRVSGVGSIGVIAGAVSYAGALDKAGIAVAVVASGSQKTDLHPALPITDAAKARLRTRVMELASFFAEEVAKARPLTAEAVLGLQAGTFFGSAAVESGLADRVGTLPDARSRAQTLAANRQQEKHMSALKAVLGLPAEATDEQMEQKASALAAFATDVCALAGETDASAALGTLRAKSLQASKVSSLEGELAALRATTEASEAQQLLLQARKDGRVTPADEANPDWQQQKALAEKAGTPALRSFYRAFRPAVPVANEGPRPATAPGAEVSLTDEEKTFAARAGLTEAQVLAQKKRDADAARAAGR